MSASSAARAALAVSLSALAVACGDVYADPVIDHGAASSPSSTPARRPGAGPPPIEEPMLPCPNAPLEGSACGVPGMTCEYGVSPDPKCNTTVTCIADSSMGGTWVAHPSKLCPTYDCPRGAMSGVNGTPCDLPRNDAGPPSDADELVCPMDDAICACSTGRDAAHAHERRWVCIQARSTCPAVRPLAGQSCVSARVCDYGTCDFKHGVQMECKGDVWISGGATCN